MRPAIFIGSSREGLNVARALEEHLEGDARVHLWTSDLFAPGGTTIEGLFEQLSACEYAIVVLTPDDLVLAREREWVSPRDNVIFELGLFMGRLGRDRTFVVHDREATLKIPTDLAGVTALTFSGTRFRESESAALSPAANKLRTRLAVGDHQRAVDFIRAYITFVQPETQLGDSYSEILSRHYNTLCAEVARLETRADWKALLEVKKRLREYFEYSGRYGEGVDFGRRYVRALDALGDRGEALWTRVKHVGYLLMLDGDHQAGRREISEVLSIIGASVPTDAHRELLFYAFRYMAISFHRDPLSGDVKEAARYLARAGNVAAKYAKSSAKRKELEARLESNRGNLALDAEQSAHALAHYRRGLELFTELGDQEHIGIAHLKIAEACVRGAAEGVDVARHLEIAESIFVHLGWIEGHARVLEQRAHYLVSLARAERITGKRTSYRSQAAAAARTSYSLLQRIRHHAGIARIESLMAQIGMQGRGAVGAQDKVPPNKALQRTPRKRRR